MGKVPARLALVGVVALLVGACKTGPGEDRPKVEVIGGGGSVSVSGVVEGYGAELYFPSTDQTQNLAIGLDLLDLRALMSGAAGAGAVDWPAVLALYEDGRNQTGPNGVRSLASLASAAYPNAFPNATAVYGRQGFIDGFLRDAIGGTGRATGLGDNARRLIVDRGVQVVQYGLALTSLGAAETHVAAGSTAEAAAAVDAGWAALAGARETSMPNNGILATGLAREEEFVLAGRLARPLEAHLFQALVAAQQRKPDSVREALEASRAYLNTIFYLSVLRDAKVLAGDARAGDREVHLAEGWTFLQALRARVAAVSGPTAQRLEAAFTRDPADSYPAAETEAVYAALNESRVLQALQIPADFRFASPAQ
jgi:hypothetical protein